MKFFQKRKVTVQTVVTNSRIASILQLLVQQECKTRDSCDFFTQRRCTHS